jgi:hypothetical protein
VSWAVTPANVPDNLGELETFTFSGLLVRRSHPLIPCGSQGADEVTQRWHTRQTCRGGIDAAGKRRALPGNTERVDAVEEESGRTNKPSLLRLLLTGNHGDADGLRCQAHAIERQAQHRDGDGLVRTIRHDEDLNNHITHLAPQRFHKNCGCLRNSSKGRNLPKWPHYAV